MVYVCYMLNEKQTVLLSNLHQIIFLNREFQLLNFFVSHRSLKICYSHQTSNYSTAKKIKLDYSSCSRK